MNKYLIGLIFLIFTACGTKNEPKQNDLNDTKAGKKEVHHNQESIDSNSPDEVDAAQKGPELVQRDSLDSAALMVVDKLLDNFNAVPYYFSFNERDYFVVTLQNPRAGQGEDSILHGLVDDSFKTILSLKSQKLYNPGLTVTNCMEFKISGRMGLFNLETQQMLAPRFDYIMPSGNTATNICYGLKDGEWWQVDVDKDFATELTDFDAFAHFRQLHFDALKVESAYMYAIDNWNSWYVGSGMVVTPSYIEVMEIMPEYNKGLFVSWEPMGGVVENYVISENMSGSSRNPANSFFARFKSETVETRSYTEDHRNIVVFDKEKQRPQSQYLLSIDEHPKLCGRQGYKFVNDSLLEVVRTPFSKRITRDSFYNFEPRFIYYRVTAVGKIHNITGSRHFPFTKLVRIDNTYMVGCYSTEMTQVEFEKWKQENPDYKGNLRNYPPHKVTGHYSIADLDIMRNEIFASYGYKFKSEKWSKYFSQFDWYKPRFDNVDDHLTEIEKANIKFILKRAAEMKNKEYEFTEPTIGYVPGGWG